MIMMLGDCVFISVWVGLLHFSCGCAFIKLVVDSRLCSCVFCGLCWSCVRLWVDVSGLF